MFGYTGKRYDNSIGGLYYYNARWYDPDYGRFITEDTRMGSQSDPMSLNRYVYARDNPEKYVDPTGHVGQMMLTDFNDEYYVPGSTTSSCFNGVCTVTTQETSDGYTTQISSTFGSATTSSGTITAMTTTTSDTSPTGFTKSLTLSSPPSGEAGPTLFTLIANGLRSALDAGDPYKNSNCKSTCLVGKGVSDYESNALTLVALLMAFEVPSMRTTPTGDGFVVSSNPYWPGAAAAVGVGLLAAIGLPGMWNGMQEAFWGGYEAGGGE